MVATPVGAIPELIGAGEAGILVQRDSSAVGAALTELIRDPARRRALGQAARARVPLVTRGEAAEAMLSLYRQLLSAD